MGRGALPLRGDPVRDLARSSLAWRVLISQPSEEGLKKQGERAGLRSLSALPLLYHLWSRLRKTSDVHLRLDPRGRFDLEGHHRLHFY